MSLYYAYVYYSKKSETYTVTLDPTILTEDALLSAEAHLRTLGELEADATLIHRSEHAMESNDVNAWYDAYMETIQS